ncbi:hypothetical protein [Streptomyces exfoliatus]|uniref:hypothetical protein n=1 Tax=Streptomyces exfoliatus TaxID=1905 RepID=UPI0037A30D56
MGEDGSGEGKADDLLTERLDLGALLGDRLLESGDGLPQALFRLRRLAGLGSTRS